MRIKRSKIKHGSIAPVAFNFLHSLPETVLNHGFYRLRHPYGIYTRSITKIQNSLISVLNNLTAVYECAKQGKALKVTELLNAQEDLLFSLLSHIDDCYLILKTVSPKIELKRNVIFTDSWLEDSKFPTVKQFNTTA